MSISVNTEMIFDKKKTSFYELDNTVRRPEKGQLRNTQLFLLQEQKQNQEFFSYHFCLEVLDKATTQENERKGIQIRKKLSYLHHRGNDLRYKTFNIPNKKLQE